MSSGKVLGLLRVMAEPTRMRILGLLREAELTVVELQEIFGMRQSRISAHLSLLRRSGLVVQRRLGRKSYYSFAEGVVGEVERAMDLALKDMPERERDREALKFVMRKRKDRAMEYFNRLAGRFGRTYIPGRSWRALAHGLLRLVPPMDVADMGCGEGILTQLLARRARRVIGVDNSPDMVAYARRLATENGIQNIDFRLGDMEAPPIEDNEVDLVIFSQALHHAANPPQALREAWRILRIGGRILILDLAAHNCEEARELYADVWLGFRETELFELLTRSGYEEVEVTEVSAERKPPGFRTLLGFGMKVARAC
ncbi:MAG: metalloregulator ArsR/SmtB family transcription factor [Chthoniobacterales bacterium]|nr:metalloregulator ArsR/SmtB family transcription factor [Chthoniobacterales bacterium]